MNILDYFLNPLSKRQNQYEAIRAFVVEKLSADEVAAKYGYKPSTIYTMLRDTRAGRLELFPIVKKGQKQRRTPNAYQKEIIGLRKQNYSIHDIHEKLSESDINVSAKTIERILKENGFEKLPRRSDRERGVTRKNKLIPEKSENINMDNLKPFNIDCPVAGIYFFLPYIIESGIIEIVQKCRLPESNIIGSVQACLSMLLLKLIGNQRLSQMEGYDHEQGFGVFAGLNVLPKSTYMSTYSCLTSEDMLDELQNEIITRFIQQYPGFYTGNFINLDFHSIPHYGDQSQMEKVWCGARNKAMKGANTVFAQDSGSNLILYTRADILRKEESNEVLKFVNYWKQIKGSVNETLVFDCKFTKYGILNELDHDGICFITLRKRSDSLIRHTLEISEDKWEKHKLDIPKRKNKKVNVFEEKVKLKDCEKEFRQIIIKDHGRINPTFIITNNNDLKLIEVLKVYAKRWHIENKIAELVAFFNLNSLSSPLMIRIHFDILWTLIADTLYHRFAQDLRRFEDNLAPTIFKKFINMPGRIKYDGDMITIRIRKRAHTPILKGIDKLNGTFYVPWLNNVPMKIEWTS
ncbi:MAG: transposase [Bacteroidetes bacterium]|nr:transposase [Bacteroidota bacterium]MBU1680418.1 transposase [Bacteroidota bacterium]